MQQRFVDPGRARWGAEVTTARPARRLGVARQVLFTGYVQPDKRNLFLRASDLLALTKPHPGENFGNVAVEAMLAGVPVVVSEHVGICREVQEDGSGLVVPLTIEAVSRALMEMLADPEKLRAMDRRRRRRPPSL